MGGGRSKSEPPGRSSSTKPRGTNPPPSMEPEPPTRRHGGLPRLHDDDDLRSRTSETAIKVASGPHVPEYAMLTVLTGLSAGKVFTLGPTATVVGRGHKCQLRLTDQGISREHCSIAGSVRGGFEIEDLDSTNGTYVNGKKVHRATLNVGDRAQIGPDAVVRLSFSDETEEALAKRLYESSTRDPLTRAYTRKYLSERLDSEVAYARRHKTPLGIIMLDLDHFKVTNDTYGHSAGDAVLRRVASEVQGVIRTEDILARFGGEEFVILVRGVKHKDMLRFAERVRRAVERLKIPVGPRTLHATLSLGVALLDECGGSATSDALLELSDQRLYRAKKDGRNRTVAD
jgi:two-component system cell cycle response regulator